MLEWAQVRVEILVPVRVRRGVAMIARTWRGWVRTEQAAAYVEYITRTGLSAYEKGVARLKGLPTWSFA